MILNDPSKEKTKQQQQAVTVIKVHITMSNLSVAFKWNIIVTSWWRIWYLPSCIGSLQVALSSFSLSWRSWDDPCRPTKHLVNPAHPQLHFPRCAARGIQVLAFLVRLFCSYVGIAISPAASQTTKRMLKAIILAFLAVKQCLPKSLWSSQKNKASWQMRTSSYGAYWCRIAKAL